MRFIIIGAGASSVAVLFNLLETISSDRNKIGLDEITWIDKTENFGPGIAYGTKENRHLFNSRTNRIGIIPEQKEHFLEWVFTNKNIWEPLFPELMGTKISGDSFLPRRLFGLYLKDLIIQADAKAKVMGITINKIKGEVTDIVERVGKAWVKTSDGQTYDGEKVIIATGNPPANRVRKLEGNPKYFPSFWPSADIKKIPKSAAITVIGTGLTAVDFLLSLQANGHTGKTTLLSSSGALPEIHPKKSLPPYQRKILTIENAETMGNAFSADAYYDMLQRELAGAQSDGFDKRSVIDSLRVNGDTKKLWNMLTHEEQKKWGVKYGSWYNAMRFRMPPESWQTIKPMFDSGQAEIIKGQADNLEIDKNAYYINCSGHNFHEDQLLQSILRNGIAASHPSGGLSADETMYVKRPDGSCSNTILAIGLLRRGEDFEANAIPEIVAQAEKLIRSLMQERA